MFLSVMVAVGLPNGTGKRKWKTIELGTRPGDNRGAPDSHVDELEDAEDPEDLGPGVIPIKISCRTNFLLCFPTTLIFGRATHYSLTNHRET